MTRAPLFERFFELAPDAIVVIDDGGRICRANAQVEAMFGYDRGELLGRPVERLLPERFQVRHVAHRRAYSRESRTRPMGAGLELSGRRKDGSEFPVDILLSPMETDDGPLVLGVVRDITDRKRVELALQRQNIELENASRAKDRFLATMSHELRTPLNAIIGFTGTLLMRLPGPLTAAQNQQLHTIQTSAKHLLSLINDLLDLAKIESGKVEIHLEPVACGGVLEEVAATVRPLIGDKPLELVIEMPDAHVMVHTDRRALSQILMNLANNAVKFTDSGRVVLRLVERRDGAQRLWEVSVSDTGRGIKPEDQAKLFGEFTRLHVAGERRPEGSGLGLYLSQRLAELIGGRITFASVYGTGSTFRLVLPDS